MIPERLIDLTTIFAKNNKRHNLYTYIWCILFRIILGLLIYYKISIFKKYYSVLILYLIILLISITKLYITKNHTWKIYTRTILIFIINIIINSLDKYNYKLFNSQPRNITGILVILDALMGIQSYHIQNNFKE